MVTFALPGDNDAASDTSGTPNPRPPLPFAKRTYVATPYATKRFGTPQSSARKAFTARDEAPASGLNPLRSAPSARNIFRASNGDESPSVSSFNPSLPPGTMRRAFAPAVTPEPSRVYRESAVKPKPTPTPTPTPHGGRSRAYALEKGDSDFRIPLPSQELTGEFLEAKIRKNSIKKGCLYADQFLEELCPEHYDDEQRRQYFCILDLRRLKYAVDEVFLKLTWRVDIEKFAREVAADFNASRTLIFCHYGVRFKGIKLLKHTHQRFCQEQGSPDHVDEEHEDADPTPTKPAMLKKRKADANSSDESFPAVSAKRRAMVRDEEDEPTAVTPAPVKNKRKAGAGADESPSKLQKAAAPSSAKSLFEKIANKPSPIPSTTTPASKPPCSLFDGASAAKPLFATAPVKTTSTSSPFNTFKPSPSPKPAPATPNADNIFGHLSDGRPSRNGGADADADADEEEEEEEAESEVESEQGFSQETVQTEQHSVDSNGPGEVDSPSSSFNTKPAAAGLETAASSGPGTRESTPGRSLFDRVTKGKDGQPIRATPPAPEERPVEAAAPLNQTWNPASGPIKFAPAPSASTNSIFGLGGGGSTSNSLFATKSAVHTNLFGAPKSSSSDAPKMSSAEQDKSGEETDKENDSRPSKKPASEARPALQPIGAPSPSPSLFAPKPAVPEASNGTEPSPAKPAMNLFASASKHDASSTPSVFGSAPKDASPGLFGAAPMDTSTSSLFGSASKPTSGSNLFGSAAKDTSGSNLFASPSKDTSLGQPSSLFGAKPAQEEEKEKTTTGMELPKTNSLFAASATIGTPANLFAPKPAASNNGLFGGVSSAPSTSVFGSAAPAPSPARTDSPVAPQPAAPPTFTFGASTVNPTLTSQAAANSLFGAPKSPLEPAESSTLGMGSPMKQDAASPFKKPSFGVGANTSQPPPVFGFGAAAAAAAPKPASGLFGSSATPASGSSMGAPSNLFGGMASTAPPATAGSSSGFNFTFGGSSAVSGGAAVNNPFASSNFGSTTTPMPAPAPAPAPSSGNMFQFGSSSAPSGGSGGPGPGPGPSSMFQFGGSSSTPGSAPVFGGAPTSGGTDPAAAAQPSSGNMFTFGANQAGPSFGNTLQPPVGGSSTTGTNSPFNLGGGSSLATTPAGGTPEPLNQAALNKPVPDNNDEDGEKHEQISLTEGAETEKHEETLHEVRAKVLKFVSAAEGEEKAKSKSPWVTQGIGPLRVLKHKETNAVRLLLRAEPRGNVALNKLLLPNMTYKADEKYVKLTTSNNTGDGLETWMIQVKTKDVAKALAEALEKNKEFNRK